MGPMIILDKSALQALSQEEVRFLSYHYTIVVTRVLILEILGDLAKGSQSELSKDVVRVLADKLTPIDSHINAPYRWMCIGNLLGHPIPMDGRPVVRGAVPIKTEDGTSGIFLDETPEAKAIMRWRQGNFSDDDKKIAQWWRTNSRSVDMEALQKVAIMLLGGTPDIKDIIELGSIVDEMLSVKDANKQRVFVEGFMLSMRISNDETIRVLHRWKRAGEQTFRAFAPYAYHCYRANLIFALGLASGLITPKPTNQVDMQYIYYLPFCNAFSSGDKLHIMLSKLFLRDDTGSLGQVFVHRDELKKDLKYIAEEWGGLSKEEKAKRNDSYGIIPPLDSVTYKIGQQFCRPRKLGEGNLLMRMSAEDQANLIKEMEPMLKAIEKMKNKRK